MTQIEYPLVGAVVIFAVGSQFYQFVHDGLTLAVLMVSIIWLIVQIWSKIKLTNKSLDEE